MINLLVQGAMQALINEAEEYLKSVEAEDAKRKAETYERVFMAMEALKQIDLDFKPVDIWVREHAESESSRQISDSTRAGGSADTNTEAG